MKKIFTILILGFFLQFFLIPLNKPVKSEIGWPTTINLSRNNLTFNRITKKIKPSLNLIISNFCDGLLKGEILPSANWIKVSIATFEGNMNEITVTLDTSNVIPGIYEEKIVINTNGGNISLPVYLDLIENKTIIQYQPDNTRVFVNTQPVSLKEAPFLYQRWSYVPLRLFCESFGATVLWEYNKERKKVIKILYKNINAQLIEGDEYIILNGEKLPWEPLKIRGNTTFVSLNVIKLIFDPEIQNNPAQRLTSIIF